MIAETIRRAWALGAGPGADPMVIDLDSTICEVHGKVKQGAALWLHQGARLPPARGGAGLDR